MCVFGSMGSGVKTPCFSHIYVNNLSFNNLVGPVFTDILYDKKTSVAFNPQTKVNSDAAVGEHLTCPRMTSPGQPNVTMGSWAHA